MERLNTREVYELQHLADDSRNTFQTQGREVNFIVEKEKNCINNFLSWI